MPQKQPPPVDPGLVPLTPITDGSQVLDLVYYDLSAYNLARTHVPDFASVVDDATQELVTAPALFRDVLTSLSRRVLSYSSIHVAPAYRVNQIVFAAMVALPSWQSLHESTAGKPLRAAMACIAISESLLDSLSEETKKRVKQLEAQEEKRRRLERQAQQRRRLEQMAQQRATQEQQRAQEEQEAAAAAQASADPDVQAEAPQHEQSADDAAEAAADFQQQADEYRAEAVAAEEAQVKLIKQMKRQTQQLEATLGPLQAGAPDTALVAVAAAEEALSLLDEAVRAVIGWGTMAGPGGQANEADVLTVSQALSDNPQFRKVIDQAGHMLRAADAIQRAKQTNQPYEVTHVTYGRDITHALPSWLAKIADPDLGDEALSDYINGHIPQLATSGRTPMQEGRIELICDGSYSMRGHIDGIEKAAWQGGFMLAILWIARIRQRDMTVVVFGAADERHEWVLPQGKGAAKDIIEMVTFLFDGGTVFEPWMEKSMERIRADTRDLADVLLISDGEVSIAPAVAKRWNEVRAVKGVQVIGLQIADNSNRRTQGWITSSTRELQSICDVVYSLDQLLDVDDVFEVTFGIGGRGLVA